jgi:hypothetical protein
VDRTVARWGVEPPAAGVVRSHGEVPVVSFSAGALRRFPTEISAQEA